PRPHRPTHPTGCHRTSSVAFPPAPEPTLTRATHSDETAAGPGSSHHHRPQPPAPRLTPSTCTNRLCGSPCHGDPAGAFDRLVERLIEKPIPAGGKDTGAARTLNWVTAMIGVRSALYSHAMWPRLAEALALADDNNDGSKLLSFAAQDPIGAILPLPYSTSTSADVAHTAIAAHTAITCADKVFPTVGAYQRLADELNRESPHFGLLSGLGALACVVWPVKAASRYTGPFHATGAAPILLVGSTGDPATPYSGAVSLARQLANSVLLTWRSYTHTAYFQDSGCVRQAVERYLVDLILPKRGTICPDVPTAAGS
ncbi:hypothetical protein ThrDRAFT_04338, partial [Frankia casuarinae]